MAAQRGRRLGLRDIPGVGEKAYEKLVVYFGSEEAAIQALLRGEVARVAEALSSPRRALRLVQQARGLLGGYKPGEMLGTLDAARLYDTALRLFTRYMASEPGRDIAVSLAPVPARAWPEVEKSITRTRRLVEAASRVSRDVRGRLRGALAGASWPRKPLVRLDRVILVPPGRGEEARRALSGLAEGVVVVEAGLAEEAPGHGLVLAYMVDTAGREDVVEIDSLDPYTVVPEAVIEILRANRGILEALVQLHDTAPALLSEAARAAGLDPRGVETAASLSREALEAISLLERGEVDPDYQRLSSALKKLDSIVSDIEVWVNEEARRRLEERELRLSAAELLRLISSLEEGQIRVPEELLEIFEEVSAAAEERLAQALGLEPEERGLLEGLVEPKPQFPIEVRREPVERLRSLLERKRQLILYMFARRHARRLGKLLDLLPAVAETLAWSDFALAATEFIEENHGSIPMLDRSFTGVGFTGAAEAGLLAAGAEVQRVDYMVGCIPYRPEGTSCERVILLTGANSGGKTTLLKTIGEIVLAAHAGLPVPASKAWIGGFDRVYYISKPTGMLDAGGLEETLRKIASIVEEARRRRVLLLVDELEAVTEAHAAARIVAAIASSIAETSESVAVIVSHLAGEVMEAIPGDLRSRVRIDGIEARGLDENYNLIVDRSPRYNYLARSTPELIVTKLLRRSKNSGERAFFEKVLELLTS
ncbi:hypothetical protein CF15_04105 [Pyrodictium occultum]|uniref:DNA mismatch repair proteins mutS family domain-containing protein n=1 Tax=Pyrodictium occultum TaxID=2309 RepID=A0A0V8RVA0_PYROC|nr:AAA family ATPase [Pyrodictium occultum]KSW11980.1 hypothetical protein CF15_04105 [Pyrodictium occultum]